MKPTEKAKKQLTLAGLGIVCVVLVIAIASQFKGAAPKEADVQPTTTAIYIVTPSASTPAATGTLTSTPEVSVKPITPTESASQVKDTGDSSGTKQSIQAEVTKPTEPSKEVITNPSQKPDGQKVTNPDGSKSSSSTPKSGDKKDGKIYVPGFGWIDDNGGGVDQKTVDGEGDINKQVGSMN